MPWNCLNSTLSPAVFLILKLYKLKLGPLALSNLSGSSRKASLGTVSLATDVDKHNTRTMPRAADMCRSILEIKMTSLTCVEIYLGLEPVQPVQWTWPITCVPVRKLSSAERITSSETEHSSRFAPQPNRPPEKHHPIETPTILPNKSFQVSESVFCIAYIFHILG